MRAITLRNIPPETAQEVERKARDWGLSLNKTVLRILEGALGVGKRDPEEPRHHDLDELYGVWSTEEAEELDQALAEQRRIDAELWE